MNLDYIAGFMDGEGSITLCRDRKNSKFRSPVVSFSNNILSILEDIQQFVDIGGSIIRKAETRKNCSRSFTLQYKDDAALKLCELLQDKLRHPAKRERARLLATSYRAVTPRNGKYSEEMLRAKFAFESQFMELK